MSVCVQATMIPSFEFSSQLRRLIDGKVRQEHNSGMDPYFVPSLCRSLLYNLYCMCTYYQVNCLNCRRLLYSCVVVVIVCIDKETVSEIHIWLHRNICGEFLEMLGVFFIIVCVGHTDCLQRRCYYPSACSVHHPRRNQHT